MNIFLCQLKKCALIVLFCGFGIHALADAAQKDVLEKAIGRVILVADREESLEFGYGFPNRKTTEIIQKVYEEAVKNLGPEYRVQFFWSLILNLNLGSHSSEELSHLIQEDCGEAFLAKVTQYKRAVDDVSPDIWIKGTTEYKSILLYESTVKLLLKHESKLPPN